MVPFLAPAGRPVPRVVQIVGQARVGHLPPRLLRAVSPIIMFVLYGWLFSQRVGAFRHDLSLTSGFLGTQHLQLLNSLLSLLALCDSVDTLGILLGELGGALECGPAEDLLVGCIVVVVVLLLGC